MFGILQVKRDKVKQLGRIPHIAHTDHANVARLDALPIDRIDPKHYRWYAEVTEGGSLCLYRPGTSTAHRGPDGLSRNPEGRDRLILANQAEWTDIRERIRGIQRIIQSGEADDEDPEPLTIERVEKENPEALHESGPRGSVQAHAVSHAVSIVSGKPLEYLPGFNTIENFRKSGIWVLGVRAV